MDFDRIEEINCDLINELYNNELIAGGSAYCKAPYDCNYHYNYCYTRQGSVCCYCASLSGFCGKC